VDFDEVKPSNINRQLYALDSTIGHPKVDVAAQRIADINPRCVVEKLKCFIHTETLDTVLAGQPDVIIDAIDSFSPKLELLTGIQTQGLAVISAMGAAMRSNPSMIRLGPLEEAKNCPLARQIRKKLRQRRINISFPCVYSIEPVADFEFGDDPQPDEQVLDRGRKRRVLPSLPTLTGIFGLTAANWAIQYLIKEVK
jgi:tRNA A37 threonylcarbamoyladenosine dehydratase